MVKLKKKVTLKKKVVPGEETHERIAASASTPPKKAGHKGWIWGVACAAVVVILLIVFLRPEKGSEMPAKETTGTETTVPGLTTDSETAENLADISQTSGNETETAGESNEIVTDGVEPELTAEVSDNLPYTETKSNRDKSPQNVASDMTGFKAKTASARTISADVPTGTIEQQALQVIRGDFGNGQERRLKLGDQYDVIQAKVNEMYRNNQMH